MSNEYSRVVEFNQKILGVEPRAHNIQSKEEAELSFNQLSEEAREFKDARQNVDLVGCVDACIDSIVFAMGILYKMGVTVEEFETIFSVVMDANMTKKIGVNKERDVPGALDAVKPADFVAPEAIIREILSS